MSLYFVHIRPYFQGFVSRSEDEEGTILVRFYDIKPGKIVRENVIYIGGAVPCPELQVGSKYQYHGQGTKSVIPIICVHVTHMFDCLDCTEIQKILWAILVLVCFIASFARSAKQVDSKLQSSFERSSFYGRE